MPVRLEDRESQLKERIRQTFGAKSGDSQERERDHCPKYLMASQFLGPALLESASGSYSCILIMNSFSLSVS